MPCRVSEADVRGVREAAPNPTFYYLSVDRKGFRSAIIKKSPKDLKYQNE